MAAGVAIAMLYPKIMDGLKRLETSQEIAIEQLRLENLKLEEKILKLNLDRLQVDLAFNKEELKGIELLQRSLPG